MSRAKTHDTHDTVTSSKDRELTVPEYIQCLQQALHRRGSEHSIATLMSLSGDAFRFFFSGRQPAQGAQVISHNPLRAAGAALGYDCKVHSATELNDAVKLLTSELAEGRGPAIIQLHDGWIVVESRDAESDRFQCLQPDRNPISLTSDDLAVRWPTSAGLLELGAAGYYFFELGEKPREAELRDAALGAFRRSYRQMFRQSKVDDYFGGLVAYQELVKVLKRRRRAAQRANDLYKYAVWHSVTLPLVMDARRSVVLFLNEIRTCFTEDEEQKHLMKTLRCYQLLIAEMESLPALPERVVAIFSTPSQNAKEEKLKARIVRALWWEKRKILRSLKRMWRLEKLAVEVLQQLIEAAERKGHNTVK